MQGEQGHQQDHEHRESVEKPVDHQGGEDRRRLQPLTPGQHIGPHELAQPGREEVVGHIADDGGRIERSERDRFFGDQQIMPTHRPQEIADKGEHHRQRYIAVIHNPQGSGQLVKIDLPEKQRHEEDTDADPQPEF